MSGASNTETKGEPEDPTTAMDHSPSTVGTTSTTTGQSSSNTSAEQPPPEKLHSDGKRGIFKRFRKDHELQLKST
jgi:hypothetical protein